MTSEQIKKLVENAKVNTSIKLAGLAYESFTIDLDKEGMFCWTLIPSRRSLPVFPMKDSQYVKEFKTEKGAKRNLIKYLGV